MLRGEGEAPPSGGSWPIWPDTIAGEQNTAQDALLAAVLVIEEAMAGEDEPTAFPESEPRAVLLMQPASDVHREVGIPSERIAPLPKGVHLTYCPGGLLGAQAAARGDGRGAAGQAEAAPRSALLHQGQLWGPKDRGQEGSVGAGSPSHSLLLCLFCAASHRPQSHLSAHSLSLSLSLVSYGPYSSHIFPFF